MHKWPIVLKDNAFKFLDEQMLDQYELPDENAYPKLHRYMVWTRDLAERKKARLSKEAEEQEARLRYEQSDEFQLEKARQKHEEIQQLLKEQQEEYTKVFKQIQNLSTELYGTYLVCLELERKMAANQSAP